MSTYEVKVSTDVDTSELDAAQKKLDNLVKNDKQIKVDFNIDGMNNLNKINGMFKNIEKNNKINVKADMDTSGIKKGLSDIERAKRSVSTLKIDADVSKANADFKKFESLTTSSVEKARKLLSDINKDINNVKLAPNDSIMEINFNKLTSDLEKYRNQIKVVQNEQKALGNSITSVSKSFSKIDAVTASNKTLTWLKNNSRAAKVYGDQLKEIAESQRKATSDSELTSLNKDFNKTVSEAKLLGLTGKSFTAEFKRAFSQIAQFTQIYGGIENVIQTIQNSVIELKNVDSILTEISKTSDMTTDQLTKLGETSFDSASKWGKKASDYLLGIQEMSRSGYYGKQAEQMAETSILAQAAGDLNSDVANSYLLASNAAYQYSGNVQKLNALLDGQNMITNRNSVSMQDMAEATTQAASMASELGVQENQLSAMIGTIESRTKAGGNEVGNAIKSLLINVQNVNNSKIAETFKKAGVAQTEFVNGVEKMRNPIEVLEDLAKVFNQLEESDPLRTEILTNIGQKYQANKLSALLSGWSDYEKMLVDYSEGTGSAAKEAEKSANNWEGSLNKLSNTWTGFIQNFANSNMITSGLQGLTGIIKIIDTVVSKAGTLETVMGVLGGGLASKTGWGKTIVVYNVPFYKVA
ncbi:MAG: phage tail tape measure protein [Mediterraneibacter gnavus]